MTNRLWIKPIDSTTQTHQLQHSHLQTTATTENTPPPVKLIIEDTPIINHDKQNKRVTFDLSKKHNSKPTPNLNVNQLLNL